MNVFAVAGHPDLATVYLADMGEGRLIEFVEACQPPYGRDERWILMVSTLFGCPAKCLFCDAGGQYRGRLSKNEILVQVDHMVKAWFPAGPIPAAKFKVQFARMGDPSFNPAVLDALEELPARYDAPGLMPSISTIAPRGTDAFFDRLIDVKNRLFSGGRFQFQFSIHTTDAGLRDQLIPVRTWDYARMAAYGERFFRPGDRKITLNFALAQGMPVSADVLSAHFDPARFLIKITPVNPTCRAIQNGLTSFIDPCDPDPAERLAQTLRDAGFETILSIGAVEENHIGTNCGQYVMRYLAGGRTLAGGYTYPIERISPATR